MKFGKAGFHHFNGIATGVSNASTKNRDDRREVWMQIFCGGISSAKGPEACAKSALKSLFQEPTQTEKLTETVDLLYYPKAGYLFISHVELGVKDMMDTLRIPALGDAIHLRIALECLQSGQHLPLLKVVGD